MKFIHIADVHLGANPEQQNTWGIERGKEIWNSFQGVIEIVKKQRIQLLLISGDLFHRQPAVSELKDVNYLFSTIPNTTIVLIAGNHDHINSTKAVYKNFQWNDNVVGLWEDELAYAHIPHLDTYVYGLSYYSREITNPVYDEVQPLTRDKGSVHILLAHGGDEKHVPITAKTFEGTRFDYIALGHIHKPQRFKQGNIIYAGSLEPLDRTEVGNHGYVLGSVTSESLACKFIPFAKRNYIPLTIKLKGYESFLQIKDLIKNKIHSLGKVHIYDINLEGTVETKTDLNIEELLKVGNILNIVDNTTVAFDLEELKLQYRGSIIERYIHYFETMESSVVNQKALYYGLTALLEAKE